MLPSVAGISGRAHVRGGAIRDEARSRSQWLAVLSLLLVPAAFLGSLLRSRLARGGVADLFGEIRTCAAPELQARLAKAAGDPSLVLAYGEPPAAAPGRAVAPLEGGALVYDAALDEDPGLVEVVAAAAAIALEHDRFETESRASRQRLVAAGDAERRRLERDLHDGAQQRLVAVAIQLRLIEADIRRDPAAAEARVTSASGELARSLEELRELARGIHPAVLEHGIASALTSLAARSTVPTALSCDAGELPRPVELALYFVACEALANVGKYAQATAASIRLTRAGDRVAIEIADDGVGGAQAAPGSGLHGLQDRVEALVGPPAGDQPRGRRNGRQRGASRGRLSASRVGAGCSLRAPAAFWIGLWALTLAPRGRGRAAVVPDVSPTPGPRRLRRDRRRVRGLRPGGVAAAPGQPERAWMVAAGFGLFVGPVLRGCSIRRRSTRSRTCSTTSGGSR